MAETQLPGVFGELQPLLEQYGYLAVGGFVLLEDFGVPVPGEALLIAAAVSAGSGHMNIAVVIIVAVIGAIIVEIYATFEHYKWYVIAAIVVVAAAAITRRVRRGRAAAGA